MGGTQKQRTPRPFTNTTGSGVAQVWLDSVILR